MDKEIEERFIKLEKKVNNNKNNIEHCATITKVNTNELRIESLKEQQERDGKYITNAYNIFIERDKRLKNLEAVLDKLFNKLEGFDFQKPENVIIWNLLAQLKKELAAGRSERIKKEISGTSWEEFKNKIDKMIRAKKDDEEKLYDIGHYIEELDMLGGIGELETMTIIRRLGGICFDCENANDNCAILPKNKEECKWFKGAGGNPNDKTSPFAPLKVLMNMSKPTTDANTSKIVLMKCPICRLEFINGQGKICYTIKDGFMHSECFQKKYNIFKEEPITEIRFHGKYRIQIGNKIYEFDKVLNKWQEEV